MSEYEQKVIATLEIVEDTCGDIQTFFMFAICVLVFWALYKFLNMFF